MLVFNTNVTFFNIHRNRLFPINSWIIDTRFICLFMSFLTPMSLSKKFRSNNIFFICYLCITTLSHSTLWEKYFKNSATRNRHALNISFSSYLNMFRVFDKNLESICFVNLWNMLKQQLGSLLCRKSLLNIHCELHKLEQMHWCMSYCQTKTKMVKLHALFSWGLLTLAARSYIL